MNNIIKKIRNRFKEEITTVTLNPVLDRTLWIKDFIPGRTFQVERSETVAGGKGVNVSRALQTLGVQSLATGIMASSGSEPYLSLLEKDTIQHDFISVDGALRTNITIISNTISGETHLRDRGPNLNSSILKDVETKLEKLSKGHTYFVFSGSLPEGLADNTYNQLIKAITKIGKVAVFDASGDPFKAGLKAQPFLIKPNAFEVKDALGFFPETTEELVGSIQSFYHLGIKNIMITLGEKGLIFSQGKEILHARVDIPPPINTVGSGDASLAGGLIGIVSELESEETVRLACAMGGANTFVSGACVFNLEDVNTLIDSVEIINL